MVQVYMGLGYMGQAKGDYMTHGPVSSVKWLGATSGFVKGVF